MLTCWLPEPADRPQFTELLNRMQQVQRQQPFQNNARVSIIENTFANFKPCPFKFNSPNIKRQVNDLYASLKEKTVQIERRQLYLKLDTIDNRGFTDEEENDECNEENSLFWFR